MKIKILIIVLVLLFSACAFLENGYWDGGSYLPKRPNYKLKDKQGSVYSIDTSSVYKLVQEYFDGKLIYPIYPPIENLHSSGYFKSRHNFYIKFCEKGRYFEVFALKDSLKKCDFDPNEAYSFCCKGYYTCNGQDVKTESFMRGDGNGFYNITNFVVNKSMDTLTETPEKYSSLYRVYKKVSIPVNFEKHKINWLMYGKLKK